MNILIDILPNTVIIDNVEYDINSDFRTSILFELLMQDNTISDTDKIISALELYYPYLPPNVEKAIEKLLWFYRCGKDLNNTSSGSGKSSSNIYSFEYDADYIYSAFLDQYCVDLQDVDHLHWWKFKAMFTSLKEDSEIIKIMGYRAMDLSKVKDKEQKSFYTKMKKLYEIPLSTDETEKINEIEEALMNGGNVSNLL